MFEGNFQFLTLARSVVETAVAAAARPDASGNGAASADRAGQRGTTYTELLEKVRRQVEQSTPADGKAIVISKGDDRLLDLPGRQGWHFPQDETGSYAGHHPADSASAIAHLESLRRKGAQFLVVPATATWWLEFYADFRRHLEAKYPVLVCRPETCFIFDLRNRAKRH
jgi:hypothetical protein